MAIQFTDGGRRAMLWAQVEAMRRGDAQVELEHLLLGLLHGDDTGALRLLDRLSLAASQVQEAVGATLAPEAGGPRVESSQLSAAAREIVELAKKESENIGERHVGTEHLLLALLRAGENGNGSRPAGIKALQSLGLTYDRAAEVIGAIPSESRHAAMAADASSNRAPRTAVAHPGFLKGRDVLSVDDLTLADIHELFEMTREIKSGRSPKNGEGKTLALVFEKPSLRTRVTFGVAMNRLGGQHIHLSREEIGLGTRESAPDIARGLSRWVEVIAARTFSDDTVRQLADAADIPVINALTDREHPCQALADFYTILEQKSQTAGMKLVFVGDGNNVAHSLMLLAPRLGTHFTLACPKGYEPDPEITQRARNLAEINGTQFEISHDPVAASDDADILYTDVWTSMGQEDEAKKRLKDFKEFQINAKLIREAKDDVIVLHCLPAHRGEEIADEVMDGENSCIFEQSENRLHVQQALLAAVL